MDYANGMQLLATTIEKKRIRSFFIDGIIPLFTGRWPIDLH